LNESFFATSSFALTAAAIALLAALALIAFVFRSFSGRRLGLPKNGRARPARLGIVDSFDLDRKRQLVIVRRDNVEHLLMIGGPNDLVIESQFVRSESREPRGYREAKSRDKEPRDLEWRETPRVPSSPTPAEAAVPVSSRYKAPSPQAAREGVPSELREGAEQNWEPNLRPGPGETENLERDGDPSKRHLIFAESLRAHAPSFALPAAKRRGEHEASSHQTPAARGSSPGLVVAPEKRETITNPAGRSIATPFLRPPMRRQAQDTAFQSAPSRAPESRPNETGPRGGPEHGGPEPCAGQHNADAAPGQAALQASTDAAASVSSAPAAPAPETGTPHQSDPLELEMARLLGRPLD
jgi:flagellar protein FliO/FliZ